MPVTPRRITPMLWFDHQAEQAADRPEGSVMTIAFELDGQEFTVLNGGPHFQFTEAMSLVVRCRDQAEVDYYWDRLSAEGDPGAQRCGWLKDRFGLSWQVVPDVVIEMLTDPDPEKGRRAKAAVLGMKKIDVEGVRRAAGG